MRRSVLAAAAAVVAIVAPLASQSLEFDVASIKRNTSNTFPGGAPSNPASGQLSMANVPSPVMDGASTVINANLA